MKTTKTIMLASTVLLALTACESRTLTVKEMVQSQRDNYYQTVEPQLINDSTNAKTIEIDLSKSEQTIKGFGTCFNELGWASLKTLPEATLQEIFQELFTAQGANFNRGRMSMGANDFSIDYYSPAETEGDFELKDFSIERDKETLIPMMKLALQYNPDIYWFASPWCPPRWMKKTKHYAERAMTQEMVDSYLKAKAEAERGPRPGEEGGISATSGLYHDGPLAFRTVPTVNDAVPGEEGYEGATSFIMQPEYLDAYARLFGKFVDAYRAEGVNIQMVMPQNEMNSSQNFPSCCWTSKDLNTFVGQYLGPEMAKRGTEVYFGTEERPDPLLVDTLLQDAKSSQYIKGVAFQWAGKDALPTIHRNYPNIDLVQSEQECGNGKNNWEGAMHSWDLQRHYLSNGVTQYYYWNTALFYNQPSRWGWYQNSLITVNADDNTWTWTPEYYELKHLSHFVLPGAKKLLHSGTYKDALAFHNPDGTVVVVVCNQENSDTSVHISIDGKSVCLIIPARSLNTVVL